MVGAAAEELVVVLENDDLYIGNVLFGKLKNALFNYLRDILLHSTRAKKQNYLH